MRILVFGASGATGTHVIEQGLVRGDTITAFVRSPEKIEPSSRLSVVQGDALDAAAVRMAMPGHDAVICALGTRGESHDLLGRAIVNIIDAMHAANVRRIIALSAAGATGLDEALAHQNLASKLVMRTAASTIMRGMHQDALALERALEESDLDYTIVRAARLTDAPRSGSYRVDEEALPSGSLSIPRGDVAEFMLMELDGERFIRKRPYIAT